MESKQQELVDNEAKLLNEKELALQEAEKQKSLVLAYVDYVKQRYGEVMDSLENTFDEEK
jgi:hypothetical protein